MPENTVAAAFAANQAGLFTKLFFMFGSGILGAAIMAAFDPPKSRRELFLQAGSAGVGSMLFGGPAVSITASYVDLMAAAIATPQGYFEWAVPVYFTVGALSWGVFAAIAKLRGMIASKGADMVAGRFLNKDPK